MAQAISLPSIVPLRPPAVATLARQRRAGQGDAVRMIPANHLYRSVLLVLALAGIGAIILIKSQAAGGALAYPVLMAYTVLVTTFELSRIIGAIFFRRVDDRIFEVADRFSLEGGAVWEPDVSFVIPCKNEEAVIAHTVTRCFAVDYPADKMEVIVVNDGSSDQTGSVLSTCCRKYPQLRVIHWDINRGKRQAMAEGFQAARGEIIVQLDSDSFLDAHTFRELIKPFRNREIGAVCAHTDPSNADQSWITKMQAAYYFISFRILKAAESTFLTVFCCSGCASAYRRSVVVPILEVWLQERFLGLPVTWGDDRALTNWVLRRGFRTIYTDRAQAYTLCPTTLGKFFKQQVRWKKGWFVNSVFASTFVLKDHPFVALTYFFPLMAITLLTPFMAIRALVINPLFKGSNPLWYIAGVLLIAVMMTLYYRAVARENSYWPYIFVWSAINMVTMSFVLLYALATIQNRRWGTR